MDKLPEDILQRVHQDFPDEYETVLQLLDSYKGPEQARVVRCIIYLSQGNSDRLLSSLHTATVDYRDVIYFAEYDQHDHRVRDFSAVFRGKGQNNPLQ